MSDRFVYFIQEEESGNIKIGFSETHPKGRLKDFQTGNSNKLILQGYTEGTPQDESNLHQEFSEERIRNENEWFEPSPRLKDRIKEMLEESLEEKKSGIEDLNFEYNEREKVDTSEIKDNSKDSLFNRQGKVTYPDGNKYVGDWKDGNEWNGTEYNKSGDILRKYVNGVKQKVF